MLTQPGFFDLQRRNEGLDAKSDQLVAILAAIPFELLQGKLKTVLVKVPLPAQGQDECKSAAGMQGSAVTAWPIRRVILL